MADSDFTDADAAAVSDDVKRSIALLDIFGFECFEVLQYYSTLILKDTLIY
jgi:hypothetical protein